jgi:hypothetical protein
MDTYRVCLICYAMLSDSASDAQAHIDWHKAYVTASFALVCFWCQRVIRPAQPGHEQDAVSHGLHEACVPAYREWAGLPPKQEGARA